ncbi:protein tincar-like isoform X2 [Acanthaster planci]|uniref:Protein tincar-like isoform X2 n=1 Tax=Acanthaster planci TaxID=133434 RepID=A0A8B7XJA5_ACAPL|nr:protein tincar-like isoform X2 [Acanthaster planci]
MRHYAHYDKLEWPQGRPSAELNLYILLILSAFLLIILFIPTQIFKVGNRANDQGKLGLFKENSNGRASLSTNRKIVKYFQAIRRVTKHLGPVGATLHFISAFCLLLPLMFLQARAIQYGLLTSDAIWRSEVLVGVTTVEEFEQLARSMHNNSGSFFPSNLNHTLSKIIPSVDPFKVYMVTLNYINYVIPLFFYGVRYADVFWFCHKGFAFVFSTQLMLNAIQYALGFIGFSLLYKLHWYGWHTYGIQADPVFQKPTGLVGVYLSNNITVFMSAVITYMYGYSRLKEAEYKQKAARTGIPINPTSFPLKCNGYIANIAAALVMCVFVACKVPLTIEYLGVYQVSKDARLLACMIFDTIYMAFWLFMWIGFTVKRDWDFTIHPPSDRDESTEQGSSSSVNQCFSVSSSQDVELRQISSSNERTEKNSCNQVGVLIRHKTSNTSHSCQGSSSNTPSERKIRSSEDSKGNVASNVYTRLFSSDSEGSFPAKPESFCPTASSCSPSRGQQTPSHFRGITRSPHRSSDPNSRSIEEESLLSQSINDELNGEEPQSPDKSCESQSADMVC